jgi:prepilin-type processing-associated H-X9-DG protein
MSKQPRGLANDQSSLSTRKRWRAPTKPEHQKFIEEDAMALHHNGILPLMQRQNSVEIVAVNCRRLRKERGWSQEEFAAKCGLHRTYVGAIERAEENLTLRTLDKLAIALSVNPAALLKLDPSPMRGSIRPNGLGYLISTNCAPGGGIYFCPAQQSVPQITFPGEWTNPITRGGDINPDGSTEQWYYIGYMYHMFGQSDPPYVTDQQMATLLNTPVSKMGSSFPMISDIFIGWDLGGNYAWSHPGGVNVAFADGHVDWIQFSPKENRRADNIANAGIQYTDYYAYLIWQDFGTNNYSNIQQAFPISQFGN